MAMKRTLDIVASLFLLILAFPPLLLITAAIVLESKGGPFYWSLRIGKNGKTFRMLKFRTMHHESLQRLDHPQRLELKEQFKIRNDPRVTLVGRWLRQLSLDEIPQLYNVIRGEMSLVGPRPKLPEEIYLFGNSMQELLSVAPGITGYWQVYRSSANSDASMREMDLHYVRKHNLCLDFRIMIRTILVMARKTNY
jgi:lipopolysaccharide/colanic/teichoic acid biosynthesis glycosyltransferase